jgi:hypothetical protein
MGQMDRGRIQGLVLDSNGAAVPGAQVFLENGETRVHWEAVVNDSGFYTIPNVPTGPYKISVSKPGFKTAEKAGIRVEVAQMIRIDVVLEPGPINETIVVTSELIRLKAGDPIISSVIEGRIVQDLPLSFLGGRQIESFAYALAPMAEGNSWTSYIAGTPAFTKEVLIDGLSATSQIQGNVLESSPAMESIQEFSVQTSGASAEYGHTSSGVFNFALKSGANNFNGSAYYYARNEALNANTWMNNWLLSQSPGNARYQRARDRQSLAGVSAGGPVFIPGLYDGRNRTFVFGAVEHYRQERLQLGAMNRTVPIPEFLEGNFSRLLTSSEVGKDALGRPVFAGQIFDPKTLRKAGAAWVSDPFAGNIIPKERMSLVSGKTLTIFKNNYQPMNPGPLTNNSAGPQFDNPWLHQTQVTLKGDHSLAPRMKLTGSLIWTQRPRILADQGGIWDPKAPEGTGGPLARSRNQKVTSRAIRLSNSWNLNPNITNTTAFVYNRYRNPSIAAQANGNWNQFLGLQSSTEAGPFPEISFGPQVNGIGTTGIGYGSSGYYVANSYVVSNSAAWTKGRHDLKFGGEFWAQQMNSHAGLDTLSFNFSPTQTGIPGQPWSNRVGFGFASFFLGEAEGGSKNVPFDLYGRREYVALFLQDDYRVGNKLTLNLGVRWEQSQPLHEKYGHWATFNPELVNTALDIKGALEFSSGPGDSFEKQKDWKEFSPRLGFAYQVGNRWVVRAGFGIYFIPLGVNYWSGIPYGFAPGYRGTNIQTASQNVPKFNWDQGYPDNYKAPARNPNALIYGMVAVDPESLRAGYTHQYNAGLQIDIARGFVAEVAFSGNDGRRLHNGALQRNQPARSRYENSNVDPFAWVWDANSAAAAGVAYPYPGFSNYAGVALQPFPHVAAETYGPLYSVGTPKGSSGYRSLQASLTRRMSGDLGLQISYTLSRATGNTETGFEETWDENGGIQDIYHLQASAHSVLSFDQTHIFKGQISWQLPFGQGRKFLSGAGTVWGAFLGGWEITGLLRYNSGNPLAVYPDVWYPGWEGAVYADCNPAVDLSRQFDSKKFNPGKQEDPGNRYFNPAAFSNPQNHKLGNGDRRYTRLRGFGYAGEDIGILKHFRLRDKAVLQLRAEFLNLFNRHSFLDPNTYLGNMETFGNVTAATGIPRVVQVGVRLNW